MNDGRTIDPGTPTCTAHRPGLYSSKLKLYCAELLKNCADIGDGAGGVLPSQQPVLL